MWWWWWLFPRVRGFWENVRQFIPRLRFFFLVEIISRTLIPLFTPGSVDSGSESCDDCDRVFPGALRVSSFPDRVPTLCLDSGIVSPPRLRWVKVYACLGVSCHLHFWQTDRGLLRTTAVARGLERTPNKSQHTKLTLEKKIRPPLQPGFELATFRSLVRRSYQQAIPAPPTCSTSRESKLSYIA